MKKMEAMKRILSFLLCFVMVFGMLPVNAFATDAEGVVISEETPVESPVPEQGADPDQGADPEQDSDPE